MAISTDYTNKFAFLFSGSADSQYIEDLRKVAETLINFYGYPAANIYLVAGATVNEFDSVNYPDPTSIFQKTGIHTHILTGAIAIDLTDDLTTQIDNFMLPLDHEIVTGYQNSIFFYFTGVGEIVTTPLTVYYLDIAMLGATPVRINPAWLKNMLAGYASSYPYDHFNILMQQSYAYGFYEGTNGINTLSDAALRLTFTSACNSSETIVADSTGSSFTRYWTSGLQFITRFTGMANIYADQEDTNTLVLPATNAEDKTNFLVSVKKAWCFAKAQSGKTPMFDYKGDSLDYLGLPSFLIQDGQPYWWESPDIYLTHPNSSNPLKHNDLYVTDNISAVSPFNNTINVAVRNLGTHPVRSYRIGIRVYRTPNGGSTDILEENGRVPVGVVLKPSRKSIYPVFSPDYCDIYSWNTPFYTGITHECVWAKVMMTVPDVVSSPFDFSHNVQVNDFEGQRNTDPGSDPPKGSRLNVPGDNFRGTKRHVYQVMNPFKETYEFRLVTLPEFQKSMEHATMRWLIEGPKKKLQRLIPETIEKGFTGISFTLKGGETKDIMGEFGLKPDAKKRLSLRLPVEVVVNKIEGSRTRPPQAPSLKGKFGAIAGFTILLTNEPATLRCIVIDKKRNPVPGATISIQTINGLAKEEFIADKKGEVILKNINPDVYRISSQMKELKSADIIFELSGGKTLEVIVQMISKAKK
jgi:hypothetical protein